MPTLAEIAGWFAPRSAEAKVVGSPTAIRLLRELYEESGRYPGEYLPEMYQRIYRAADAHPATVEVRDVAGLLDMAEPGSSAAEFEPGTNQIRYEPDLARDQLRDILPHELLHFLNANSRRRQPVETQHSLIRRILGRDVVTPEPPSRDYQPGPFTPVEQDVMREWFQPAGGR